MYSINFKESEIRDLIDLFYQTHEEVKRELGGLASSVCDEYFFKKEYEERSIAYEKEKFFDDAKVTYHNYYCFVFAKLFKELFPKLNYYERYDGGHVAIGTEELIFDICGVYHILENGEFRDNDGDLYWCSEDDEWFLDELNYFGTVNDVLEKKLKNNFYQKVNHYLQIKSNI